MGMTSTLFGILMNVAILLVFLRFLMQLAMVNPYNPVVLSTIKATKIVDIFSSIFPTLAKGRVNLAALVLLVMIYLLKIVGVAYLSGVMPHGAVHLIILTFVTMIQDLITFCRYLIFATVGYYLSAAAILSLLAFLCIRETKDVNVNDQV